MIDQSHLKELPINGNINVTVKYIGNSQSIDSDRGEVKEN